MSSSILYAEINGVCILFLLLISIKARESVFLQSQRNGFLLVSCSNILLFLLDAIWIFVDSDTLFFSIMENWWLNGTYYALGGLIGYFWFCFSETIQESKFARSRNYRCVAAIPAVLLIVLTILSYWNHALFYIDSNNVYHRGPAFSMQVIVSYGYVIFTAVRAFYHSCKADDFRRKMELRALSAYVVPTIIAGTLQIIFPQYPTLCIGTTLGILFIYISLQEQMVSKDAFTQLNNRNQLFQYLSAHRRRE